MLQDLCKRNCLSNGFDFDPDSLSFLGVRDDYHEPTFDTSQTISLVTQFRNLNNTRLASADWWLIEIWLLRGIVAGLCRS